MATIAMKEEFSRQTTSLHLQRSKSVDFISGHSETDLDISTLGQANTVEPKQLETPQDNEEERNERVSTHLR